MQPRDGPTVATAGQCARGPGLGDRTIRACSSGTAGLATGLRHLLAGLAVAASLAVACPAGAANAPRKADPEDLRELRARIERLKTSIADAEETRAEARDALRESERAISEANRQLHNLTQDRQAARSELAQLGGETRRIETELAQRQEAIGRMLTVRYLNGEADYLKLLVSGADPNQTARELHYYSYISRAQAELIRALRASLARMQDLQEQTREKTAELARIEASQKSERNRLSKEQSARKGVLDKVSARLREQRRQVRGLERDESRLSRLVEELGKVLAEQALKSRTLRREPQRDSRSDKAPSSPDAGGRPVTPAPNALADPPATSFAALKGSLRLPVRGTLAGRFGSARPDGGPTWKGLFIRANPGLEVRAVAPGRVVFSEWMRGFGNLLILDHGEGYLTIYGNNEAVLKQVGDTVRSGDTVATTGASGGSSESGLYFEARHEGRPFDPLKWLASK
jgi:septal ring factor EnvC (AmiA/AmiB activator)